MNTAPSRIRFCSLVAAIALSLSFTASAGELLFVKEPIPGQYIVVLKESAAAMKSEPSVMKSARFARPTIASVALQMGHGYGFRVMRSYDFALRGFAVQASDKALARLVADPRVAYVEENGVVHADGTQSHATWGLDRIDQRDLPLNGIYNYDATAPAVHAYIIDSGIYAANIDFGNRVSGGIDFIGDVFGTTGCHFHGTHVAGTVGGTTWGVAKQVKLHPVRVLDCSGSGTYEGVIAGIDWVAANHINPAVANLSLGGSHSQALDDAVTRLIGVGVTTVVAAGNDSVDACTQSPASAPLALTVGATSSTDARAAFSNFGRCVDLFAPGVDITSAGVNGPDSILTISGTSMAAPHVTGAVALYLALNPNATPAQTIFAIVNTSSSNKVTDPVGSPNFLLFSKGFNSASGPISMSFSASSTRLIAKFADSTTSSSGYIVSRVWDFGDGGSSTAAYPSHVYQRSGTYLVRESVEDSAGYRESLLKSVTIR